MTTIKLKNGSGAPDAADLVQGEVALDLTNKRIYSENASGTVIEMGTSPSTIDINAGTIDGAVIGGASAAAGTFTTLNATGGGALTGTWSNLGTVTTVDINGGTIDGTTIGGASAGAITGTTITGTSFVSSGNMTFGDDDKAIFGAGSDLQIYHDGSASYIKELGSGPLSIQMESTSASIPGGTALINLLAKTGASLHTAANLAIHQPGSAEGIGDFRFSIGDGSGNLTETLRVNSTGIDVTGTVTADGLTVDGGFVQRVSLGNATSTFHADTNTSPVVTLELQRGTNDTWGADAYGDYRLQLTAGNLNFDSAENGVTSTRATFANNGDISFYEDTGVTPKLFWDASAESLGIGTTSPEGGYSLTVNSGTANGIFYGESTDAAAIIALADTSGSTRIIADNGGIRFTVDGDASTPGTNDTEAMRIDSSGNLLVGATGTPTSSVGNFVLYNGTAPTGNATNGVILYAEDVSASSELKVRDEAGNVTTLSPHNFDLIPEGPSEDMAWSYYSERDGKRINVDMLKAIRLLEQLTGEKLVHTS